MKKTLIIITALLISSFSFGQVELDFQRCYGGTGWDTTLNIMHTSDGGYLMTGTSSDNDGDVSENHGDFDAWVVKLNSEFDIEWEKSLGGSNYEYAYSGIETDDGNYLIVGMTSSEDGDFITHHGGPSELDPTQYYNHDSWVAKINSSGETLWVKCFGGIELEEFTDIKMTNDGNFIICGFTLSSDGDITNNNGSVDAWIVKINADGDIIWQNCYGTTNNDKAKRIEVVNDGYVILGELNCSNCEGLGHHGSIDLWLFKIDESGIMQWQKFIGGSSYERPYDLTRTIGGGYLITSTTNSTDGDAAENSDGGHLWVVKTDNLGNMEWNTRLGGYYADLSSAIEVENEKFLVVGSEYLGEPGFTDIRILQINNSGEIEWEEYIGGDYFDRSTSIIKSSDNEFIIVGATISSYGDIFTTHCTEWWCESDGFLLKISTNSNISGYVFYDENENNTFDTEESGLSNQMVKLEPGPIYTLTNTNGYYYFDALPGDYTVTYLPNDYWINIGDENYEITVSDESDSHENNNFSANTTFTDTDARIWLINLTQPRADELMTCFLVPSNIGSESINGTIGLKFDPLLSHSGSDGTPVIQGDSIIWDIENFNAGQIFILTSTFQVPGVEYIGDTIQNIAWISPNETDNNPNDNRDTVQQVIVCAYDPNDKQVSPLGYGEEHFITHGERLTYTIRFQNTGTDTAFFVMIRDTINQNLDLNTFNLGASSHPVSTSIREGNELVFTFNNIVLPDSIVNEPESHGFVQYSISPKPNLDDYTEVTNKAYIYFDYNPAIETNITSNHYISIIPVDVPLNSFGQAKISVYPNPAQNELVVDTDIEGLKTIKIIDTSGKTIIDVTSYDNTLQQDISSLENGIYIIIINNSEDQYVGKIIKQN